MSAEALGDRLLEDVEVQGLDELLSDLRHLVQRPKPGLGIAWLDRLLEVFCAPAQVQTAAPRWSTPELDEDVDLYVADERRARHLNVLQTGVPQWKPVVLELTSSLPACGKTNLLYYITALAVLPGSHGGQGRTAVWLDTDGRFSATRLREVALGVISSSPAGEDDTKGLLGEALSHIHVFRPRSSQQLLDTLDLLPSYLLNPAAHLSIRKRLGLLILDTATAFYWQDRFDSEIARFLHPDKPSDKPSRAAETIKRLKKMQKEFECAVAYSTSSAFAAADKPAHLSALDTAAPEEPRSVSPWTASATLTLILSRLHVPRFSSQMSLEECLRDQGKRQDAVGRGGFVAEVDRSGSETWPASVKEECRRMEAVGSFRFSIGMSLTL